MSLILAVEPDRRQAKQLSSLVRQHVRAELVVADSGSAALSALKDRIPDLILTPPLLPPRDEAVLTGWLRELGDAGAHVQTLAIPILSSADTDGREQGSSIFGRLRDHQSSSDSGCDPGVFAEQVRVYLDRAGVERSNRVSAGAAPPRPAEPAAPTAPPSDPAVPVSAATEESAPEVEDFEEVTFEDLVFEPGANEPAPAPTPIPVSEPPLTMRAPTPFARPEKKVEPAVLKSWEAELGLETAPHPAPPLWQVTVDAQDAAAGSSEMVRRGTFDPSDARYAPLFRRLDEVAAGVHA